MAKLSRKQLEAAHQNLRNDARQRVAERGILQFRADAETVLAVMDAADRAQKPVGALLRDWVQEKLMIESAEKKSPDLIQRVSKLEDAVKDLRRHLK